MNDQKKLLRNHQEFDLMNGAVRVWIEQETIHLVAFDRPHHDPVELTSAMARRLAAALKDMADGLDE